VGRVAAINVAKASGMVCTRVPHATKAGKPSTTIWQVPSTTNQVLEVAEQLAGEGIERVVVESTSEDWRPLVYLLEARGLVVWLVNARDARAPAGPAQDRQAGCGVVVQAAASGACWDPGSSRAPRSAGCGRTPGWVPT
jgi:transposase